MVTFWTYAGESGTTLKGALNGNIVVVRFFLLGIYKFSFLKAGLPSIKTTCALCMLGTTQNLVIVYTALKPRHRRTSAIVIEWVGKILFWQKKNTNSYLKRHLAPYTE